MTTTTRTLAIVGCGARKLGRAAPAGSLYTGPLFRASLAYAQTLGAVKILSAKHGLLSPDRWIEPYEQELADLAPDELATLRARVASELTMWLGDHPAEIIVLAGYRYVDLVRDAVALRSSPRWDVRAPMAGMGMGARLQWLHAQLTDQGSST